MNKKKFTIILLTFILFLSLGACSVQAARTIDFWKTVSGTRIQTTKPTGYNILINGLNKYLNFNALSGSSGYGMRDNGGSMEFKDSGDSWTSFTSLINLWDEVTGGINYGGGNVGIGTTTPEAELAVEGDALINGNITSNSLNTGSATTTDLYVENTLTVGGVANFVVAITVADDININGCGLFGTTATTTICGDNATSTFASVIASAGTDLTIRSNSSQDGLVIFGNSVTGMIFDEDSQSATIGGGTTQHTVNGVVENALWEFHQDGNTGAGGIVPHRHTNTDTLSSDLTFLKSRGDHDSPLVVNENNQIGHMRFAAYDGTDYALAADIAAFVDGTPGDDDMPGRLSFFTSPDGTQTLTERMTIKNDGNVGIGTTSPYTKLSVVGEVVASHYTATTTATSTFGGGIETNLLNITSSTASSTFANGIDLSAGCFSFNGTCVGGGSGGDFSNGGEAGGADRTLGNTDNFDLGFLTNNLTRLHIQNDGNVGIGTSTPSSLLHITSAGVTPQLILSDASAGADEKHFYASSTQGALAFGELSDDLTTFTERMRINGGGNVGIGTSNPQRKLHVTTPTGNVTVEIDATSVGTAELIVSGTNGKDATITLGEGSNRRWSLRSDASESDSFYLGDATNAFLTILDQGTVGDWNFNSGQVYFDNGGRVGIGTTSPTAPFEIYGSQPRMHFIESDGSANENFRMQVNAGVLGIGTIADNGAGYSEKLSILQNGNVGIGTTTPNATLNVHTGDGGAMIPNVGSDDLVVENAGGAGISILTPDGSNSAISFGSVSDVQGAGVFWNHDSNIISIGTQKIGGEIKFTYSNGFDGMRLDSNGNFGIGTTTPEALLTVGGFGGTDGEILVVSSENRRAVLEADDDGDFIHVGSDSNHTFQIVRNSNVKIGLNSIGTTFNNEAESPLMTLLDGGNLGIGITTPNTALVVRDAVTATDFSTPVAIFGAGAFTTDGFYGLGFHYNTSSVPPVQLGYIPTSAAGNTKGALVFATRDTTATDSLPLERMRITSAGLVGIGTTSPTTKLEVNGGITLNGDLDFWDAGSGLIYGSMGQHDVPTTVTITGTNVFATTTGMSGNLQNNVTFQNSQELLVASAGVYEIEWGMSFNLDGSNEEIEGAIGINGVAQLTFATAHRHISTANDTGDMGSLNYFRLEVGDVVTLMVANETNTSDVIVDHANLTIKKIGG